MNWKNIYWYTRFKVKPYSQQSCWSSPPQQVTNNGNIFCGKTICHTPRVKNRETTIVIGACNNVQFVERVCGCVFVDNLENYFITFTTKPRQSHSYIQRLNFRQSRATISCHLFILFYTYPLHSSSTLYQTLY